MSKRSATCGLFQFLQKEEFTTRRDLSEVNVTWTRPLRALTAGRRAGHTAETADDENTKMLGSNRRRTTSGPLAKKPRAGRL